MSAQHAFVPDHAHDVFVSYAWVDDQVPGTDDPSARWVHRLCRDLQVCLDKRLGRIGRADLWIDRRLDRTRALTPEVESALTGSAVLLVVLSEGWLESDWCRRELALFEDSHGGTGGVDGRIFVVHLAPIAPHRRPAALRDLIGFDLYRVDSDGREHQLGFPIPLADHPGDRDYFARLDDLSRHLAGRLEELRGATGTAPRPTPAGAAPADSPPAARAVYIAHGTPDLRRWRDLLLRQLEQSGIPTRPARALPPAPANYRQTVMEELSGSLLFVQVLGPYTLDRPPELPQGYEALQLELAQAAKLPSLRWMDPDAATEPDDPALHASTEVTRCGFEDFKRQVETAIRRLTHAVADAPASQVRVLIRAAAADAGTAETIAERLRGEHGIGCQVATADLPLADLTASAAAGGRPYQGLLIVGDRADPHWSRRAVGECRVLALELKERAPVCGLLVAATPGRPGLGTGIPRFHVLNDPADPALTHFAAAARALPTATVEPQAPGLDCPYPGLRPFGSAESHLFFGRARQVGELLTRLETRHLVAVVGVSGCGKSSLVRAGLIPAIQAGYLDSPARTWRIALMRPGRGPFAALATALLGPEALGPEYAGPPNAAGFVEGTLRRGRLGLLETVAESGLPAGTGLLLVVDQFEEVFRYRTEAAGRDEADAFVDLLLAALVPEPGAARPECANPVRVVLTLRSDYLGDCAVFAGLPEAIDRSQLLTPRLSRDQYRDAIREPARRRGARLEPRLVSQLLNDLGEDPDRLPLLQHALMRLWTDAAARPGWDRVLTLDDYDDAGGLAAALSRHCDQVYAGLADEWERRLARTLFRALCERSGARRDSRRPQPIAALAAVAGVPPADLHPVINAFRRPDRSLLGPPLPEPLGPETVLDIAHESLIGHWEQLSAWVDAEEESGREYRRLADAADLHTAGKGGLLRSLDLKRLQDWRTREQPNEAWAERYGGGYAAAMAFLEHSDVQAGTERRAALETRAKWFMEVAGRDKLIAPQRCLLLALEAYRAAPHLGAAETMVREALGVLGGIPLIGHEAKINAVAFSPDGLMVATGSDDCTIRLWDRAHPDALPRILTGHARRVTAVAFSADSRTLASGSEHDCIRLWDLVRPDAKPMKLQGNWTASKIAFSRDGRIVAVGSWDGTIRLWNLTDPDAEPSILRGHEGEIVALAVAPDGSMLASSSNKLVPKASPDPEDPFPFHPGSDNGFIRLWDLKRPEDSPRLLRGHKVSISLLSFAPRGNLLASTFYYEKAVRLWDLTSPESEPRVIEDKEGFITAIAFSPEGNVLARGRKDGTIKLCGTGQGQTWVRILHGHEKAVTALAFAQDGKSMASASDDAAVRLWSRMCPEIEARILYHYHGSVKSLIFSVDGQMLVSASTNSVVRLWYPDSSTEGEIRDNHGREWHEFQCVALAPDGRTVASGSHRGSIYLWDTACPWDKPLVLRGHQKKVTSLAFSPDGRRLTSASEDQTIRVWDPAHPETDPFILEGHDGPIRAITYAPDGKTLASASADATVRLWNPETPGPAMRILRPHHAAINSVTFAPDGRTLATGSDDKTIRKLELERPDRDPLILKGHIAAVKSVAFAPDGRTLASASTDETIRLWDLAHPDAEPRVLRGHGRPVNAVAFAPNGAFIASGGDDSTVRLWDLDLARVLQRPCEVLSRNLSATEWLTYFGAEPPAKTCANRPIHPSYLEAADELAKRGNVAAAVDAYRRVLADFDSHEFDPQERARRIAAPARWEESMRRAEEGDLDGALADYAEAKALVPDLPEDAAVEYRLCRWGGLWSRGADVLVHCDRLVALRPGVGWANGWRVLARAQTGDLTGAAEDLRIQIGQLEAVADDPKAQAMAQQRREWLTALESGRNPFDAATLEALRRD